MDVQSKYEREKELNTVQVYEAFIEEHYESIYADSALLQVQKLELSQSIEIQDFEKFERKYPKSIYIDSVRIIIDSLKYLEISNSSNLEELENFVLTYPNSEYIEVTKMKINEIKEENRIAEAERIELEKRKNDPCYGIILEKYWQVGKRGSGLLAQMDYRVIARVRNKTNETKFVYLQVKNTNQWGGTTKIKVYANDVWEGEIDYLSNFDNQVRIVDCQ